MSPWSPAMSSVPPPGGFVIPHADTGTARPPTSSTRNRKQSPPICIPGSLPSVAMRRTVRSAILGGLATSPNGQPLGRGRGWWWCVIVLVLPGLWKVERVTQDAVAPAWWVPASDGDPCDQ